MGYNFKKYLKEIAGVTDDQYQQLEKKINKDSIHEGELVLQKGQVCKHFFYVEQGLLRFYSVDGKGKEHILEFAPEKWIIGDRGSYYFNEPTTYFIDAIEETTMAVIDNQFLDIVSDISPQFRKYNERILHNHIRQLQNRINKLIGASAEERYTDFLNMYSALTNRVPQWMIASYLGITPESLSRIRKNIAGK